MKKPTGAKFTAAEEKKIARRNRHLESRVDLTTARYIIACVAALLDRSEGRLDAGGRSMNALIEVLGDKVRALDAAFSQRPAIARNVRDLRRVKGPGLSERGINAFLNDIADKIESGKI